ncbi:ATPase [Bordetella genomosp. 5]|uniref:histidine kinase n=1 Tax=Bordetella genomosp. 5 TaxID=1395608 RepID=A0A261TUZ0_9BORD|nr:GAF domain-containing protein [Bordetella genomosp. 5]OZI43586.1 ATPase [Bordetella genomosp. 5]OZI52830.1 ATPase [Bordetella genomosp. 5]
MLSKGDQVSNPWTDTLARLEDERVMLQRIAAGVPLADVLAHVLHAVEAQSSVPLRTAISFLDDTGEHLIDVVGPSLPQAYLDTIEQAPIGPTVASWGAAAYFCAPVYVDDIAQHPNWTAWRDEALAHGLRACWSTPIRATDGRVLGVFSNYYLTPHTPSAQDIDAIALVTRTAALVIERYMSDRALRRSSERWRGIFERMQEGFFLSEAIRDRNGQITDFRFLEVNPALERQSGLRAGDTLGRTLREMFPRVPDQIMQTFINVVETGEPAQFEIAVPGPREGWYEARARREGHDQLTALFLDVSARKAAEAELWEGQHRKSFLLTLGDTLRNQQGQHEIETTACEALGRHLGLGVSAVVDVEADDRVTLSTCWFAHGEDELEPDALANQLSSEFREAVRSGKTAYLAPFLTTATGTAHPSALAVPMRRWGRMGGALYVRPSAGGRIKGNDIAFIEEVAERVCDAIERAGYSKMLEQRVEFAIAERDRIWRLSPELLAVVNAEGRFISVNPAVRSILGWSPDQFLSMPLAELVHAEDLADTLAAFSPPQPGQLGARHLESRLLNRNGSYSWITWSMAQTQGMLYLAGRDDTEMKAQAEALAQTADALRQSQKMEAVGRLTGGIAHDFNNMLQGISGALYLIRRKLASGKVDEVERFINTAMESTERAARLTQRLLTFSRRQPIDPKPLSPARVLTSMEDLFRRYIGEHVALVLDFADDLAGVRCDGNQLENALLNLVINGRDAMPDGGTLRIRAENRRLEPVVTRQFPELVPGEYVALSVIDTGVGMPPDVVAQAFDPFFTTKPLGEGTGLGLSMIYGFAQQAGGVATIQSAPGRGTTVTIFLPRYDGVVTEVPPDVFDASVGPVGDPHAVVALVEDDAGVREMVRASLEQLQVRVITAADGEAGRNMVCNAPRVDVLLTDVGLPGLNGRQLADAARITHPHVKIILMTGYAENAARGKGFLDEGMELIVKPFHMEELTQRVSRVLRQQQMRQLTGPDGAAGAVAPEPPASDVA